MTDKAITEKKTVTNQKLKGTTFLQKLFTEHPLGVIGALICLILLLTGIFADYLAPYGMNEVYVLDNLQKPNEKYFLGADPIGRDVFSRIIYGARISMIVGLGAATYPQRFPCFLVCFLDI